MGERFDVRTLGAYGWVGDLIAADEGVRAAAWERHRALLWRVHRDEPSGTLVDLVDAFSWRPGLTAAGRRRLEPYAVLFLRWEAGFPVEWRAGWYGSPWSSKAAVLATFVRCGATAETAAGLKDLLIGAVHRVQRCQDRWYWRMARRIDSAGLRIRLRQAAEHAEQRVRLRARYVLWLIEHPDEVVTSRSWRRWRRTMGVPVTAPCPPSQLAALPAAQAAALLGGLSGADLAGVFEAVEAGPAARIATAIGDVAVVASAVEMMDARTAARLLAPVPERFAADVLAAMAPAAAAARFPTPERDRVWRLMSRTQVLARLSAMTPAMAGLHLQRWPTADAAEVLMALDPGTAADAVANMPHWWAPGQVLAVLPDEDAQTLLAAIPVPDRARVRWLLERERFRTAARTSIAAADR